MTNKNLYKGETLVCYTLFMTTAKHKSSYFSSLKKGLLKTKSMLIDGIDRAIFRAKKIDENLIEELEEILISADIGVKFTLQILNDLRQDIRNKKIKENQEVKDFLKEKITNILEEKSAFSMNGKVSTYTIMVIGVNGSGKTTTIGKLAYYYSRKKQKVLLGAGDTFRAAAIEQLNIWAERTNSNIISHKSGADPSAVVFDSMKAAKAGGADVLIIDTAGRLHTNTNLMEQLKKMKRVISKEIENGPHEILLIMDATTGQNGLAQARVFHEALDLTGIVLTKLDSTSKGGIIIQIIDELNIPIKFIGTGEQLEDLGNFNPEEFANVLFS